MQTFDIVQSWLVLSVLGLAALGIACKVAGSLVTRWKLTCAERKAERLDFWKYRLSRLERSWNSERFAEELEKARAETSLIPSSLFSPSLEEVQAELDSCEWVR